MTEKIISVKTSRIGRLLALCTLAIAYLPPASAISIDILSPADLFITSFNSVDVSGNFDPMGGAGITIDVNGIPATVAALSFIAPNVPIVEGSNSITAVIADSSSNTANDTITVIRDQTPPLITIDMPNFGDILSSPTIDVKGFVFDAGGLSNVSVNGVAASFDTSSYSALGVPLVLGPNIITAVATDLVGNTATTDVPVTLQAPEPTTLALLGLGLAGTWIQQKKVVTRC